MHALDDAYDIFVPGYGQCWVTHDDVAKAIPLSAENARNRWRPKTHSITKLSIHVDQTRLEDREGGLRVLLKLIGTPITHLALCLSSGMLDHSYFDLAWTYCPQLIRLTLIRIHVDSFDDIVDAYSSGRCRASELSMDKCKVQDPASVFEFVGALADPTTAIAQTLRQLRFSFTDEDDGVLIEDKVLAAFFSMLEANRRLRYLELVVSLDQFARYNDRFAVFRGQTLRYPLSLSEKCAFLSVVKHAQLVEGDGNAVKHPIDRLDSLALSRIFFLASEPASRSVVLYTVYLE